MNAEQNIRKVFAEMEQPLASYNSIAGGWQANSQYGIALAYRLNKKDAEQVVLDYYRDKLHLLNQ